MLNIFFQQSFDHVDNFEALEFFISNYKVGFIELFNLFHVNWYGNLSHFHLQ